MDASPQMQDTPGWDFFYTIKIDNNEDDNVKKK